MKDRKKRRRKKNPWKLVALNNFFLEKWKKKSLRWQSTAMCCYLFILFLFFLQSYHMICDPDETLLFLFCFAHSIVLNDYNCWVDTHFVRVCAWRKTKRAIVLSRVDFHICAPFDTHSNSIWYLSTCPANTHSRTHTHIYTHKLMMISYFFVCYFIWFHFISFFKKNIYTYL